MKNAFRLFEFDVANFLRMGKNYLLIRFHSLDLFFEGPREDRLAGWFGKRCFIRKPQFNLGWDWALPLPSLGLTGKVCLELNHQKRLTDVAVTPHCDGKVYFNVEVSKEARNSGYAIEVELNGHGECLRHKIERYVKKSNNTVPESRYKSYCCLEIKHPQLWYPNGYGKQPLYNYKVSLNIKGETVDCRKGRIGLRESQIYEKPFANSKEEGVSFGIQVNGIPIFCKGANWVPLELCPANATKEQ